MLKRWGINDSCTIHATLFLSVQESLINAITIIKLTRGCLLMETGECGHVNSWFKC